MTLAFAATTTAVTTATTSAPTVTALHNYVSTKADPADATIIGKTKWNDAHAMTVGTPTTTAVTTAATNVAATCAAGVVLGNNSGSAGTVAELTPSQIFDLVTTTPGMLLLRGASAWAGSTLTALLDTITATPGNFLQRGASTWGAGTPSTILDTFSTTPGAILTRGASVWAAAANVAIDSGDLNLKPNGSPTTPSSGVKLHGAAFGGRPMLGLLDANGRLVPAQASLGRTRVGYWTPPGNGTTVPSFFGVLAPVQLGSMSGRNVATTSLAASTRRLGYSSAAAAASAGGIYLTAAQYWRGNGAGLGGFYTVMRWTWADSSNMQTTARMFVGLSASVAAPADVDPSTITNIIGVGNTSGDSNLSLYAAGGTAQAAISLGATMPCNATSSTNVDAYELILYCPPNASGISYQVTRLNTGDTVTGTITATAALPSTTTLLGPRFWRSNGATAAASIIDLVQFYVETEI